MSIYQSRLVIVMLRLLSPVLERRAGCAGRCMSGSGRRGRETGYRALPLTPLPMGKGFVYLVAVMDWYSRRVLSWRVSTTMDTSFCVDALEEAIERYGCPEIFNTDQGSQFTSEDFTQVLLNNDIKISMDGKGRFIDNIFIERFWRSLKYDYVYLRPASDGIELYQGIKKHINYYNHKLHHQGIGRRIPADLYKPAA